MKNLVSESSKWLILSLVVLVMLGAFSAITQAQYVVKSDDTLWGIAEKNTQPKIAWQKIYDANNFLHEPGRRFEGEDGRTIVIIYAGEILQGVDKNGLVPTITPSPTPTVTPNPTQSGPPVVQGGIQQGETERLREYYDNLRPRAIRVSPIEAGTIIGEGEVGYRDGSRQHHVIVNPIRAYRATYRNPDGTEETLITLQACMNPVNFGGNVYRGFTFTPDSQIVPALGWWNFVPWWGWVLVVLALCGLGYGGYKFFTRNRSAENFLPEEKNEKLPTTENGKETRNFSLPVGQSGLTSSVPTTEIIPKKTTLETPMPVPVHTQQSQPTSTEKDDVDEYPEVKAPAAAVEEKVETDRKVKFEYRPATDDNQEMFRLSGANKGKPVTFEATDDEILVRFSPKK